MSLTQELRAAMAETRAYTLALFRDVDDDDFSRQAHPDFSPLGWHLGHIGVAESFWILQQCQRQPTLSLSYERFFTPTENPKANRRRLPPRAEILSYLEAVRARVFSFLESVDCGVDHPLLHGGGIFNMLLQHEEQHTETIQLIRRLLATEKEKQAVQDPLQLSREVPSQANWLGGLTRETPDMVFVPGGAFFMGSDDYAATLDNERPRYVQEADAFVIDRFPVTNAEYARFVESGGYHRRSLWSDAGWRWREQGAVARPLYWRWTSRGWCEMQPSGIRALLPEQAVMGVSWYEAEAYARFVSKRLPTEAEWEKAATLNLLAQRGHVWEWTSTWFAPYPGFVAHPYAGYSVPYFDEQHRVLRGGSWATRPHVKRTTFRNWYQPGVREIFAGLRCAKDA